VVRFPLLALCRFRGAGAAAVSVAYGCARVTRVERRNCLGPGWPPPVPAASEVLLMARQKLALGLGAAERRRRLRTGSGSGSKPVLVSGSSVSLLMCGSSGLVVLNGGTAAATVELLRLMLLLPPVSSSSSVLRVRLRDGGLGGVVEGVAALKEIDEAAGMGVGLGTGAGAGIGVGSGGGAVRLGTGAIIVDVDGVGVAVTGESGVSAVPLIVVEVPPPPVPDGPASAGSSSKSNSMSIVLLLEEPLVEGPLGAVAASNVFHLGFIFCAFCACAFFAYSLLPFFPVGGAGTPLYVAKPGALSTGRPSMARQRGARKPKSGTAACIGSSFSPPLWIVGSRGKSWSVRGTPSRRALTPACAISSALEAARSVGVWLSGVNWGISLGSAGTGSRKLVPVVGCCQGSKASAPATLKLCVALLGQRGEWKRRKRQRT
jgi:hypothetical protein